MELTRDDEVVITEYLRGLHEHYDGPVLINMQRLIELHMVMSKLIAAYLFCAKKLNDVRSARDMVIKYQAMKQELAEMKKAVRHD
ncbi:hypothetical protein [Pragia fontium]|uniref:hypothetical protein n=1 Tax=Pragia fontium TaxID=82985 RepID=UPI000F6F94BB|nr:hypothetical protein [Pragia fontium]VEJ54603.1 Uncharacterised protein [Pragia fontium]